MTRDGRDDLLVSVAVPVPLRRLFTYRVERALRGSVHPGLRVRVPLGRRRVVGTVVEMPAPDPGPEVRIRSIQGVVRDEPDLREDLLSLTSFVSEYYLCSWGEAIEAALPPRVAPVRRRRTVDLVPGASSDSVPARAVARRRVLERLRVAGKPLPLDRFPPADRQAIRALERLGLVAMRDAEPRVAADGEPAEIEPRRPRLRPTPGQAAAIEELKRALASREYAPHLLFGPTGSGKTEVYLRAAEEALTAGRGVLYLVPEIGLTPLLVGKIAARFEGRVEVLHSGLSPGRRRAAWERLYGGACRFVVGTRSAVFAPVHDPGLVVVDEEQDASYKQEETPRYNGRDLAVVRAREVGAVLLMGSATPSMESFQHARAGRYRLLRLEGRVENRPLPEIRVVDMRAEFRETGQVRPLSRELVRSLVRCLEREEQALVLRNRRGWAAAILCPACGRRIACPKCSIAMTWHRAAGRLRCHYCGRSAPRPRACPNCGEEDLRLVGEGTERIEDELRAALPGARVARMDRDTVRGRGAHEKFLRKFERGEIDVLVGTQMIAKGHDFPRVTLVGVLSADQSLGLPDFRAAERTFQILTQVAGRAGRGDQPGEVVVQAFDTGHYVMEFAKAHDYLGFFDHEIRYRRALRYPPFSALVELVIRDADEIRAREWARLLEKALRKEGKGRLLMSGPGPAPIERLRGKFRQQILLRSAGRRWLVGVVGDALKAVEGAVPRRAIRVDVDPLSLM